MLESLLATNYPIVIALPRLTEDHVFQVLSDFTAARRAAEEGVGHGRAPGLRDGVRLGVPGRVQGGEGGAGCGMRGIRRYPKLSRKWERTKILQRLGTGVTHLQYIRGAILRSLGLQNVLELEIGGYYSVKAGEDR